MLKSWICHTLSQFTSLYTALGKIVLEPVKNVKRPKMLFLHVLTSLEHGKTISEASFCGCVTVRCSLSIGCTWYAKIDFFAPKVVHSITHSQITEIRIRFLLLDSGISKLRFDLISFFSPFSDYGRICWAIIILAHWTFEHSWGEFSACKWQLNFQNVHQNFLFIENVY